MCSNVQLRLGVREKAISGWIKTAIANGRMDRNMPAINGIFARFNTPHGLQRQLGRVKLDEITHS